MPTPSPAWSSRVASKKQGDGEQAVVKVNDDDGLDQVGMVARRGLSLEIDRRPSP